MLPKVTQLVNGIAGIQIPQSLSPASTCLASALYCLSPRRQVTGSGTGQESTDKRKKGAQSQHTDPGGQACVQVGTHRKGVEGWHSTQHPLATDLPYSWLADVSHLLHMALTSGLCLLKESSITFIPNKTGQLCLPP